MMSNVTMIEAPNLTRIGLARTRHTLARAAEIDARTVKSLALQLVSILEQQSTFFVDDMQPKLYTSRRKK